MEKTAEELKQELLAKTLKEQPLSEIEQEDLRFKLDLLDHYGN